MVETLSKNITRQGLTATTLNYLRVSMLDAQAKIEELPPFEGEPPPPDGAGPPQPTTQADNEFPGGPDNYHF